MKKIPENLRYYLFGLATAVLIVLGLKYINKPDYIYNIKRHNDLSQMQFSIGYQRSVNGEPWGGVASAGARVDQSFNEIRSEWLAEDGDSLGFIVKTMQSESGIDPNEPISKLEITIKK